MTVKDPMARIHKLERHCEALGNALAEIKAATLQPKTTMSALRKRIMFFSAAFTSAIIVTINCVSSVCAGSFQAVIELSSLDGTNGFRLDGANPGDLSGYSVASAGDMNGDNIPDLVIGAPAAHPNGFSSGSAYVVFGRSSGFPATISLSSVDGITGFRLDGSTANEYVGSSVAPAGDVNGDGIRDLIIGANAVSSGHSYVVFGRSSAFPATMNLSNLDGTDGFRLKRGSQLGWQVAVARAGDVNDDGFDDILIGVPSHGSSFVVFGRTKFPPTIDLSGLDGTDGFQFKGRKRDSCGTSVAGVGDINDDGIVDIIVGAPRADARGMYSAGSSYVIFGKQKDFPATIYPNSLDGITGFRIDGATASDSSGFSVSRAGDVNGDGISDVIIGAYEARGLRGSSYVVFGNASRFRRRLLLSTLDGKNGFRINGENRDDWSGRDVSNAGDINGDGISDLIIGAPGANPNGILSGSSYIVYGRKKAFRAHIDLCCLSGTGFRLDGMTEGDYSGSAVASAGDVNDDGVSDIIIGAPSADPNGNLEAGSSYVVFGKQ